MNIERNEDRILIKYVDSNFMSYKCIITIEDIFIVNFCRKSLEKMEKILQNYVLEKIDDYYLLKIEEPICLEYQLKREKIEEHNMELIFEKLKKLEDENKKMNCKIQRLDKITNELLFENRILREYVPIINTSIANIQDEINDTKKLRDDEKNMIIKLFNQIREKIIPLESLNNDLYKQQIINCESSIQHIKRITDTNMRSILEEIDHIYSIIESSKILILNRIDDKFGKSEESRITHPQRRTIYHNLL